MRGDSGTPYCALSVAVAVVRRPQTRRGATPRRAAPARGCGTGYQPRCRCRGIAGRRARRAVAPSRSCAESESVQPCPAQGSDQPAGAHLRSRFRPGPSHRGPGRTQQDVWARSMDPRAGVADGHATPNVSRLHRGNCRCVRNGARPSIPPGAIQALNSLWLCPSALSGGAGRCRPVYRSPRCRRSWRARSTASCHASMASSLTALGSCSALVVIG
jgi:hypothetical protein